jgi:predicted nucleic acid-binding protein
MRVFVDTSAFYAVLDRDDANHGGVREAFCYDKHFREQGFGTIP